jgi:hypothetical protein
VDELTDKEARAIAKASGCPYLIRWSERETEYTGRPLRRIAKGADAYYQQRLIDGSPDQIVAAGRLAAFIDRQRQHGKE